MGCDIHGYLEVKESGKWRCEKEVPDGRSYDWFGILAGVRNYVNAIPISEPRGIPNSLSKKVMEEIDDWQFDGHSHSWLTSKDFENYDWKQTFIDGRISTIEKATGKELSKAVYTNPKFLDKERFELKSGLKRVAEELIPHFWVKFIAEMKELSKTYGDENVRIIFWFDN